MTIECCIPVIPSADLQKSLRFWVEGLGLTMDREMRRDGKLIGCMVHANKHLYFWLNQRVGTPVKPQNYEGIRLYWAPSDIRQVRERLKQLGYAVSDIAEREYGQTEFLVTDDDGFSHCFGVSTKPKQPVSRLEAGASLPLCTERPDVLLFPYRTLLVGRQ